MRKSALFIIPLVLAVGGCGIKGDLYLPEVPAQKPPAPAAAPVPPPVTTANPADEDETKKSTPPPAAAASSADGSPAGT